MQTQPVKGHWVTCSSSMDCGDCGLRNVHVYVNNQTL